MRYNNPRWLAKPVETFWEDSEKMRWNRFYNETASLILSELDLLGDETALALAKNLWHYANEREDAIRRELLGYKELKKAEEDARRMTFSGVCLN